MIALKELEKCFPFIVFSIYINTSEDLLISMNGYTEHWIRLFEDNESFWWFRYYNDIQYTLIGLINDMIPFLIYKKIY